MTEGTQAATSPPRWATAARNVIGWARRDFELAFLLAALIALIVGMSMLSEFFLTARNIQELLLQTSVLAIVSYGVTVVIISGNFDLSVGAGVGLAGIVIAEIALKSGSLAVGLLCGLGVGVAIGLINGVASTVFAIPSFIVTLAMLVIARGLALAITEGQTTLLFMIKDNKDQRSHSHTVGKGWALSPVLACLILELLLGTLPQPAFYGPALLLRPHPVWAGPGPL